MQCAICGAEARNLTPGDVDGLIVSCKRCGDYEVDGSTVNGLLRLGFEERRAALEKARASAAPGAMPKIDTDCLVAP